MLTTCVLLHTYVTIYFDLALLTIHGQGRPRYHQLGEHPTGHGVQLPEVRLLKQCQAANKHTQVRPEEDPAPWSRIRHLFCHALWPVCFLGW